MQYGTAVTKVGILVLFLNLVRETFGLSLLGMMLFINVLSHVEEVPFYS